MFFTILEHTFIHFLIITCVLALAVELVVFPLACVNVVVLEIVCALAVVFAFLFLALVVGKFFCEELGGGLGWGWGLHS